MSFRSYVEEAKKAPHFRQADNYAAFSNMDVLELQQAHSFPSERFDQRLLEALYERLAIRTDVDTQDLRLEARAGTVMLDGSVWARPMRAQIERVVSSYPFVKSVVNRLKVRSNSSDASSNLSLPSEY